MWDALLPRCALTKDQVFFFGNLMNHRGSNGTQDLPDWWYVFTWTGLLLSCDTNNASIEPTRIGAYYQSCSSCYGPGLASTRIGRCGLWKGVLWWVWNINRLKGDYLINVASNCAGIFNYFQHGILFSQKCLLFHCFYINFNCGRPMNFSHHFCPGCGGVIRCQSDLGGAYHRSLARTNLRRNHVKLSCVKTGSLSSNQGGWVVPWFRGCIVTHGNGWDKGMNWYHEFKYGVLVFVKVYRYTVPKAVLY